MWKEFLRKSYNAIFGKNVSKHFLKLYDIRITVDKAHRDTQHSVYIWIDQDGTVMQTPIVHQNDKVEFGRRNFYVIWNLYGKFKSLAEVPLGTPSPLLDEYQKLFSQSITKR